MKNKIINILMIAPGTGRHGGGGIANYADILTNRLSNRFNVTRIITLKENNLIDKLMRFVSSLLHIIPFIVSNNQKIAHINTAHQNSFWRKAIFVKLLKIFNIPIIIHLHSSEFHLFFKNSSSKKQNAIRNIFKMADRVIVLSNSWKEWYVENIEERIPTVIYNGMDDFLGSDDQVSERENKILFLGRLGHRKGIYDLIKAFETIKHSHTDAKLLLGGDGEIEECKDLVDGLRLTESVEFLGWIGDDQKKKLLNTCKVFTLPSYNEGFPLSILEAMSAGLAIVSTKVGGIPEEVINGNSGLLIEAGDTNALAQSIIRILSDDNYCDSLGENARIQYLDNFTLDKILKDVESIYLELVEKN
ncbi:MAG: glycosyltransferase [Helicobacteraceae bacterium]|nr:glycosyltransferase [Helicobacteraceae bacterium]